MKKSLFLFASLLLLSLGVFAGEAPESLSMTGSALAESDEALLMKKIDNGFELITSLQTGTYSFEGDNSISEGTITEDNDNVPYRIRVNYDNDNPVVTIEKIQQVIMWTPWSQYTVGELKYIGDSRFLLEKQSCITELWGDARYRIRILLENDKLETYGPKDGVEFALIGNGQWGEGNDYNYEMEEKYRNTNIFFNIELILKADETYKHLISEYIPERVLFIKGSALAESDEPMLMKAIGNTHEIFTLLKSGNYSFEGDDKLTEEKSITVEDTELYYIAVNYEGENPVITMNKIERVEMWVPWSEYTAAELSYKGNSVFEAENLLYSADDWVDSRFRIKIFMEDDIERTYGGITDTNELVVASNSQWGGDEHGDEHSCNLPERYRNSLIPFNLQIKFSTESGYLYEITDFVAALPICENVWLERTDAEDIRIDLIPRVKVIEESSEIRVGVFDIITELVAGTYIIKGQLGETIYSFTIEEGKLVEGNNELVVEESLNIHYVNINFVNKVAQITPISSFCLWYIWDNVKIPLTYKGEGIFSGYSDDFELSTADWGLEGRYKYMIIFEDNSEVWLANAGENRMFTLFESETKDQYEFSFNFDGQTRGRTTWTVNFASDGNYTQEYQYTRYELEDKVPFNNQSAVENASVKFTRSGLEAGQYSTLYLPFATTLENIEVYAFNNSEENTINFVKVETVEANTPYLIKPTVDMDLVIEKENITLEATTTDNSVGDNAYRFLGSYENIEAESGMYGISPTDNSFVQAGENVTIPAFRAYLQAIDASNGAPSLAIGIDNGGSTDLSEISFEEGRVYAVNSTLYVVSDIQTVVNVYAIDGRLVRSEKVGAGISGINGLAQGVYIVNGRKVVIR